METIFIQLCMAITGKKKRSPESSQSQSRWTQVIHAYNNLRQCVINNARVMTETTIQLSEVNTATLAKCRSQETKVLQQAIPCPEAPITGPVQQQSTLQKEALSVVVVVDNPRLFPANQYSRHGQEKTADIWGDGPTCRNILFATAPFSHRHAHIPAVPFSHRHAHIPAVPFSHNDTRSKPEADPASRSCAFNTTCFRCSL
ncbi:uncharacterized protein LOC120567409 [Perca fluviatilis]|uniref:uncharacterized protein LOC120567409 n=1 Tax=Perca fluviatilis TaxID=8168 RepID=UPI001963744D|nr:uncharacterized protein LOC120567409 [Perca fluviatilis]